MFKTRFTIYIIKLCIITQDVVPTFQKPRVGEKEAVKPNKPKQDDDTTTVKELVHFGKSFLIVLKVVS